MSLERKIFIMQVNWCVLSAIVAICLNCGDVKDDVKNTYRKNTAIDSTQKQKQEVPKWVLRNPLPTGKNLYSVAFGNGQFVAVGDEFLSSIDGRLWSKIDIDTSFHANRITFGNGRFVATNSTDLFYISSDGVTWKKINSTHHLYIHQLKYYDSLFVAVGDSGCICTSKDGEVWQVQNKISDKTLYDVAYGNGRYVAIGNEVISTGRTDERTGGFFVSYKNQIVSSTNGFDWVESNLPQELDESKELRTIVFGNGKFIAITFDDYVFTSQDGIRWQYGFADKVDSLEPENVTFSEMQEANVIRISWPLYYLNDLFIGHIGVGYSFSISPNCSLWTKGNGVVETQINSIVFGNGKYVAVGFLGTILSSTDGITWVTQTTVPVVNINGVVFVKNKFVAVGNYGLIATSTDGISWTVRDSKTSQNLTSISYTNSLFIALCFTGEVLTSNDGIIWTRQSFNYGNLQHVVWGANGLFLIESVNGVLYSQDGKNWAMVNPGGPTTLRSVAFGNGKIVGLTLNQELFISIDGINWSKVYSEQAQNKWFAVVYKDSQFVAISDKSILTSSDCTIWKNGDLETYLAKLQLATGSAILVGPNGKCIIVLKKIKNQIETEAFLKSQVSAIAYGNGRYVAVGEAGTIVTLDKK